MNRLGRVLISQNPLFYCMGALRIARRNGRTKALPYVLPRVGFSFVGTGVLDCPQKRVVVGADPYILSDVGFLFSGIALIIAGCAQVRFLLHCQPCNGYLLPVNGFHHKPPLCKGRWHFRKKMTEGLLLTFPSPFLLSP